MRLSTVQCLKQLLLALKALVERLESDLLLAAGSGPAGAGAGCEPPPRPDTPDNGASEPEASSRGSAAEGGGAGASTHGDGGLLGIVVNQRDRFRGRCAQLEEEKGALEKEAGKVRRQLDEVRADNLALYEKVRGQTQHAAAGRPGNSKNSIPHMEKERSQPSTRQPGGQAITGVGRRASLGSSMWKCCMKPNESNKGMLHR